MGRAMLRGAGYWYTHEDKADLQTRCQIFSVLTLFRVSGICVSFTMAVSKGVRGKV